MIQKGKRTHIYNNLVIYKFIILIRINKVKSSPFIFNLNCSRDFFSLCDHIVELFKLQITLKNVSMSYNMITIVQDT